MIHADGKGVYHVPHIYFRFSFISCRLRQPD
jgi:hypothetical protein